MNCSSMRGSSSLSEASESYPSPGEKGRFLGRGGSGLSFSLGVLGGAAVVPRGGRVVLMTGLDLVVLADREEGVLLGFEEVVEDGLLEEDGEGAVGGLRFLKRILGTTPGVLGERAAAPEAVGVGGGGGELADPRPPNPSAGVPARDWVFCATLRAPVLILSFIIRWRVRQGGAGGKGWRGVVIDEEVVDNGDGGGYGG